MIKGKFYSGLTSEMMTRSRNVNRQETHFFWPDESDAESVTSPTKRAVSKPAPFITNNHTDTAQSDIKPKELVRKQLSSGIQFYDNVNAKTPEARRRRFKKIDNVNLNNNDVDFQPEKKKLETFSSKIEFYDFEHENNAKNAEKAIKAANVDDIRNDEIKAKNESPEVNKKRISFRTADKSVEKTKSILKNSDEKSPVEKVLVKSLPKRGLLPKNLSKSVENISKAAKNFVENDTVPEKKSEKLSSIINEVKSLNLSQERTHTVDKDYDGDENDSYYRGPERNEHRRSNMDRDYDRRYPNRYEDREYRNSEYKYRNEDKGRNDTYKYNNRYDDYDDHGEREFVDRRYERPQKVNYSQPRDNYEYRERPRRYEERSIRERRSPIYDRYGFEQEYEAEPRKSPIKDHNPTPRKTNDSYRGEPPNRIRYDKEEYSSNVSRKPNHIPQHLRTNILFNGHVRPQAERPMSVRNSAVTRVGVGLPDIE